MIVLKDKKSEATTQYHEDVVKGLFSGDLYMITLNGTLFRVDLLIRLNLFPFSHDLSHLVKGYCKERNLTLEFYAD